MKILIADDDRISQHLLRSALEKLGHEVVAVTDGEEAIRTLNREDGPRLAILDWMMPGADGLTVVRSVRALSTSYVYAILLTARDSRGDMVEALDSGADDFLTKPFNLTELRARLRSGIRVIELQERLLQAQEALRVEAARDSLTGIWNRGMILEQLRLELKRAKHEKRPLAVVLADIDHFKRVNDTYGHAAGDQVLRAAAQCLRTSIRDYDFIGRYGGEEFLAVLPGCDAELVAEVAERLRSRLEAMEVFIEDKRLPVTMSVGTAWTPTCDVLPDALIATADAALYRAKANGRNRVEAA